MQGVIYLSPEQSMQWSHPGVPLMNKPFAFGAAEETLSQAITGFASKKKLGFAIPLFSFSHHVYPY